MLFLKCHVYVVSIAAGVGALVECNFYCSTGGHFLPVNGRSEVAGN